LNIAKSFDYGLNDRSRMSCEVHVRFSEGPRVKFPRPTQPRKLWCFPDRKNDGVLGASVRCSERLDQLVEMVMGIFVSFSLFLCTMLAQHVCSGGMGAASE
jgi:hypothetical protein